jgi:alpha-beta hydrolase superfamily lysophospholipase
MLVIIPGVLLLCYVLAFALISVIAYRQLFRRPMHSLDYSRRRCLEAGEYDAALEELPWETAGLFSPRRNASLALYVLAAQTERSSGTVIVLHGLTWTHYGSFKYASEFITRGWNIVLLDLPGHGASGQGAIPVPSYGYYEKDDLAALVDWTIARFPDGGPRIVIGESLGAATALQYAPLGAPPHAPRQEWKIQGLIADCSYSSLACEVDARLRSFHIPYMLARPVRKLFSFALKRFRGYSLEDASPLAGAVSSPVPMLFIHGAADTYVPASMSALMAEQRQAAAAGPAVLALIPGAAHAKSIVVDRNAWFKAAFDFIKKGEV